MPKILNIISSSCKLYKKSQATYFETRAAIVTKLQRVRRVRPRAIISDYCWPVNLIFLHEILCIFWKI